MYTYIKWQQFFWKKNFRIFETLGNKNIFLFIYNLNAKYFGWRSGCSSYIKAVSLVKLKIVMSCSRHNEINNFTIS